MFTTHVPGNGKFIPPSKKMVMTGGWFIVLATLESVAIFWGYIPLALRPKMAIDGLKFRKNRVPSTGNQSQFYPLNCHVA